MRILLTYLFFIVFSVAAVAQQFNYTQYQNTPLHLNPGLVSAFDDARLYLNYRNQRFENGDGFHSSMLSGLRPLVGQGVNRISLGFIIFDDRNSVQSNFSQQKLGLALGMNLAVQRDQQISLGFGADYIHKRFSTDGLTTGSQYVENRGFDPNIANGESFDRLTNNYLALSLGAVWTMVDSENKPISRIGVAWRDFNRPDDSFFDEEEVQLPSTFHISASYQIYRNSQIALTPEVLFTQFNGASTFQIGSSMSYFLKQENSIDFRGGVLVDKGLFAGFQYVTPKYEAGFSYDFPVGGKTDAFDRTLEFSLILKKPVVFKEKEPKVKTRKKKVPKSNRNVVPKTKKAPVSKPTVTPTPETVEAVPVDSVAVEDTVSTETEEDLSGTVDVGEITPEGIKIETISRNIEFDFNSTHITDSTHLYLDPLANMLKIYPHIKIRIVGHTDNVGHHHYNKKLSLRRANAVREYLMDQGVNKHQIDAVGKGDSEPIDTNDTEAGRARNRRVVIEIVE